MTPNGDDQNPKPELVPENQVLVDGGAQPGPPNVPDENNGGGGGNNGDGEGENGGSGQEPRWLYRRRLLSLAVMGAFGGLIDLQLRLLQVDRSDQGYIPDSWWPESLAFAMAGAAAGLFVTVLLAGNELKIRRSFIRALVLALAGGLFWHPVLERTRGQVASDSQVVGASVFSYSENLSRDKVPDATQLSQITQSADQAARKTSASIGKLDELPRNSKTSDAIVKSVAATTKDLGKALKIIATPPIEAPPTEAENSRLATTARATARAIEESLADINSAAMNSSSAKVKNVWQQADSELLPRVYIQCDQNTMEDGETLRKGLIQSNEFLVPSVEKVGISLQNTEVRFFYPDDLAAAQQVAAFIDNKLQPKYVQRRRGKSSPGLIEVWYGAAQ